MRYFSYQEPIWDEFGVIIGDQTITMSEDEIRAEYFPYWESKMIRKFGREVYERTYRFQDCLDDWIVDHWATEVRPEGDGA